MSHPTLTEGCLEKISSGQEIDKPILQIISAKKIVSADNTEKYRLLVSDGKYLHSFAMLATQLNNLYTSGQLSDYTIIRVERHMSSTITRNERGETRLLIILDLTILKDGSLVNKRIGTPGAIPAPAPAQTQGNISNGAAYNNNNQSVAKPAAKPAASANVTNQSISGQVTHPISSLSPYQNKWVIKARVTSKSAIRTWSKPSGDGKLFSMELMDDTGDIRTTAFKEQCDKFYDFIEVDKVYYISKAQVKAANKQYSNSKHDYEMVFTNETVVQECVEEESGIPAISYNLVPISQIADLEPNAMIDVCGVCTEVQDIVQFTAKSSGRELKKREFTIVDMSNASVNITLWGTEAEQFNGQHQPIILIKSARVGEFGGGKTLGTTSSTVMKINPDIPEGHKLRGWYDNGNSSSVVSVSARTGNTGGGYSTEWMTLSEAQEANLGNGEKPDYFQCKALIHNVKSANALYKACPQADCNKKVVDQENGQYRCEKCNADYPNFKYRLLVNMLVGDWTSNRWVTCFTDLAEQLFGKTSAEIGEAAENSPSAVDQIFSTVTFEDFIFKLRTKIEFYGDAPRAKTTAVTATPINYKSYNAYLIKDLEQLTGISKPN